VIDKWTHRQFNSEQDIVAVQLIVPEIVTRNIEVPTYIIKKDLDIHVQLTREERLKIVKEVEKDFRLREEELEANILAYQDLLITKEVEINELNLKLNSILTNPDLSDSAKVTI
jgi:hypothetical protein